MLDGCWPTSSNYIYLYGCLPENADELTSGEINQIIKFSEKKIKKLKKAKGKIVTILLAGIEIKKVKYK